MWTVSIVAERKQKTLASGTRVFGRNSDSVMGDKAGLLNVSFIFFFF